MSRSSLLSSRCPNSEILGTGKVPASLNVEAQDPEVPGRE